MFSKYPRLVTGLLSVAFYSFITTTAAAEPPEKSAPAPKLSEASAQSVQLNEKGVAAVKSNDFGKAEQLFHKALAADRNNLTAVFNLAGVYLNNKRQHEAISLLDTYIQNYGKDAGLFARRGDSYFSLKDLDSAAKDYEKTLKLDPEYPAIAGRLATVYTLLKRNSDAEKMFLKAVELDPKNGQMLQNLSSMFLANGKPEQAISTAKRGLQVAPTSELYVTLGNAYELLGDMKNSLISFQRASDLGDSRPELKAKIDELKKAAS